MGSSKLPIDGWGSIIFLIFFLFWVWKEGTTRRRVSVVKISFSNDFGFFSFCVCVCVLFLLFFNVFSSFIICMHVFLRKYFIVCVFFVFSFYLYICVCVCSVFFYF